MQNGWKDAPFSTNTAAVVNIGGIVTFRSAIATAGTNPVAFTPAAGLRRRPGPDGRLVEQLHGDVEDHTGIGGERASVQAGLGAATGQRPDAVNGRRRSLGRWRSPVLALFTSFLRTCAAKNRPRVQSARWAAEVLASATVQQWIRGVIHDAMQGFAHFAGPEAVMMATVAERQVAHIWRRLGFGATGADIDHGVSAGPGALIDDLLNRALTTASDWNFTTAIDVPGQALFLGQQLRQMTLAGNPLQERLAWILQGQVVVALQRPNFQDITAHVKRLRGNPFASYKQLLTDVTTMRGMLRYLNGSQNARLHPNQNYGRELMELFSLGITHPTTGAQNYTETDVQEVSRALTGWIVDKTTGNVVFDPTRFDSGDKTFLGQPRGIAGVPEVMAAISGHPAWGYFVPRRLYLELVGLEPDAATLDSLAAIWGSTGDVRAVVSAVVHLPAFLSDAAIGARVKSPVELVVNGARVLGYDLSTFDGLEGNLALFGQDPFIPPDVSGWPIGAQWVNTTVAMIWSRMLQSFVQASRAATNGVVQHLLTSISDDDAPGLAPRAAARMCGIVDLSRATAAALSTYVSAGSWDADRAAGTLALVLVSPEFLVN